ncbi:MAG: hypothetical protein ACLKAK_07260 [Alkaliphilus sp.]
MNQFNQELPKGMLPPAVEASEFKNPVSFSLERGNYVAAIYQALKILPVEVSVDECLVTEKTGMPPEVRLMLRILGEKKEQQKHE